MNSPIPPMSMWQAPARILRNPAKCHYLVAYSSAKNPQFYSIFKQQLMDVTTSSTNYLIFLIPINAVFHGFEQIWKYIMKRKLFLPIFIASIDTQLIAMLWLNSQNISCKYFYVTKKWTSTDISKLQLKLYWN